MVDRVAYLQDNMASVNSSTVQDMVNKTVLYNIDMLEFFTEDGLPVDKNADAIIEYKLLMNSYGGIMTDGAADADAIVEAGKSLLTSEKARRAMQQMVDLSIVLVDLFCFMDVDLFGNCGSSVTQLMQHLMSKCIAAMFCVSNVFS